MTVNTPHLIFKIAKTNSCPLRTTKTNSYANHKLAAMAIIIQYPLASPIIRPKPATNPKVFPKKRECLARRGFGASLGPA